MKFIVLFLLLVVSTARASEYASCQTDGPIANMKFETVVDIFSINNARTLSLELQGESLRFTRSSIVVMKNTTLQYIQRTHRTVERIAKVVLDRTPREALLSREFNGTIEIKKESGEIETRRGFYCYF